MRDIAGPSGVLHRIGYLADPFSPPPWSIAGSDGTFGNRFDDPDLVAIAALFGLRLE